MKLAAYAQMQSGYYFGQDGALVLTSAFQTVFLRLGEQHIVTALYADGCVAGIVEGKGNERDGSSAFLLQCAGRPRRVWPVESFSAMEQLANAFEQCALSLTNDGAIITFGGRQFSMQLAAEVDESALMLPQPADETLSIAEKLFRWNRAYRVECADDGGAVQANLCDGTYDLNWAVHADSKFIYCRIGVNGYCDRGWAMKSTVVLRASGCRMLWDHRDAMLPYKPEGGWFVENGCAFPADGGWYWSVKDATADRITLNGCGGDVYTISRRIADEDI